MYNIKWTYIGSYKYIISHIYIYVYAYTCLYILYVVVEILYDIYIHIYIDHIYIWFSFAFFNKEYISSHTRLIRICQHSALWPAPGHLFLQRRSLCWKAPTAAASETLDTFLRKIRKHSQTESDARMYCYVGLSENRVYSQWNSHLIGIMISKTIGFRGTLFSDTPMCSRSQETVWSRFGDSILGTAFYWHPTCTGRNP